MSQQIRENVLTLMKEKEGIENEIKELSGILTQNGVGMHDALVDVEGFPINSIDVYQVRHARHRIICLQNDHKAIMNQIEQGLQGYYSETKTQPQTVAVSLRVYEASYEIPFVKVTAVSDGSPAFYAGLLENDQIVEFGSVNHTNFKNVTDIAAVVQHSEGVTVHVKLKRGGKFINTQLTPKKWLGKGLLGCNIVSL